MLFRDVDLIPILGAGSRVEQQVTVTASNREQFMIPYLPASCAALKALTKTTTPSVYAPQVGWHVVYAVDANKNQVDLWVEPTGRVWRTDKCIGTGTSGGVIQITKEKGTSIWLFVALAVVFGVGWYLNKKKD